MNLKPDHPDFRIRNQEKLKFELNIPCKVHQLINDRKTFIKMVGSKKQEVPEKFRFQKNRTENKAIFGFADVFHQSPVCKSR